MKNTALALFFCLFLSYGNGQSRISLPFTSAYDENAILLMGIQYNYVNQNYQLTLKNGWQKTYINYPLPEKKVELGDISSIHSYNSHGFSVSIPVDIRANEHLYFNFSPSFLFVNNSGVKYGGADTTSWIHGTVYRAGQKSTNFNSFEFPLAIKYRSDEKTFKNKFTRYRGYILGGARYSRFIGINKEHKELSDARLALPSMFLPLIVQPSYFSWEAGIGVDLFFPYFKMSPEIRFSQSFRSVLNHDHGLAKGNIFMDPLEKGMIRNIYVSLIFQ